MFKVSFKETANNPSKAVIKTGRVTTVMLRGYTELPHFWPLMPPDINEWIAEQTKVELYEDMAKGAMLIHSEGLSKCMEGDKYDSLLGERLAESRAKMHIYKFFYDLCCKLYDYYNEILFGNEGVVATGDSGSLERTMVKYEKLYGRELSHQHELLKGKENG